MAWVKASKKVKDIALENHNKAWAKHEGRGEGPDEKAAQEADAAQTKAYEEMLEENKALAAAEAAQKAARQAAIEERKAAAAAKKKAGKRKTRRRRRTTRK